MSSKEAPDALTCAEKAEAIRYYKICGIITAGWIILGFVSSLVWPNRPMVFWQVICSFGWLATMAFIAHPRVSAVPRRALGLRYAGCAAVLFIYLLLWTVLFSSGAPSRFGAYIGTMLGCIYVLSGISGRGFKSISGINDHSLIGLGAVFTIFSIAASALPSAWFGPTFGAFGLLVQLAVLIAHRWKTRA